jgi:hypothetical protein
VAGIKYHDIRKGLLCITRFYTPEWFYNLECGSIKSAGGHNLDVEARVLLKISWPPENPTIPLISGFILFMVKMVLSLVLLPVMHSV